MTNTRSICISRLALAGLLRLLEHLLDDLLLLDQESTDDTVLDATGAARTTVGTADVLLGARDLGVFTGAESGNLKSDDVHRQHSVFPTGHIFQDMWWLQSFLSTRFPSRTFRFFHLSTFARTPTHPHRYTCNTNLGKISLGSTHTRELDATVTTLGSGSLLLDVEVPELAAGGLDDTDLVGPRVVPIVKEFPSITVYLEQQSQLFLRMISN